VKIALVILHADPARGGAERYTVDLANALARRGQEARVIATSFTEELPAAMRVTLDARGFTRAGRYQSFLDALDAHLATNPDDIVHAMLPVRGCDVYHPHAGIAAGATSGWSAFFNPRRTAMAETERALLTAANPPVVLSLSEYSKADVLRHYPNLPPEKLVTLFNAVDLDRFRPSRARRGEILSRFGIPDTCVVALIIANDFARKGLMEAMRATAAVNDPRLALLVLGKQDLTLYRREAEKMRRVARIAFAGSAADPRPFYQAADFFVLPTKHDPCSLVVLEALAMGLPVISTRFNGACEIMTDGVHGYVLPDPRDIAAISDAMRKMLDDARRAQMAAACLELRPRLSYEQHLNRLLEVYQSVVAARTQASSSGTARP